MPRPCPLPRPLKRKPARWNWFGSPIGMRLPPVSSSVTRVKSPAAAGARVVSVSVMLEPTVMSFPSRRVSSMADPFAPFQVSRTRSFADQGADESLRSCSLSRTTPPMEGGLGRTVTESTVAPPAARPADGLIRVLLRLSPRAASITTRRKNTLLVSENALARPARGRAGARADGGVLQRSIDLDI